MLPMIEFRTGNLVGNLRLIINASQCGMVTVLSFGDYSRIRIHGSKALLSSFFRIESDLG